MIRTDPKYIVHAIDYKKTHESTEQNHVWLVSLLNPGESLIFDYSVYSEESVQPVRLTVVPRKKNWTSAEGFALEERLREERLGTAIAVAGGTVILLLSSLLLLSFPVYRLQWNRRPELREQYTSFLQFWVNHKPRNLFD